MVIVQTPINRAGPARLVDGVSARLAVLRTYY
jgi:hypothetical protein